MDVSEIVLKAISEKKGRDIEAYDTRELTPFMDTMIVATADNLKQNAAIAQNIKERLAEAGWTGSYRVEGDANSNWILVDLKDVVVHLFVGTERQVYSLERLYHECPLTRYE